MTTLSTGRPRHVVTDDHLRELARLEAKPWFKKGRAIQKVLDRFHNIPWLGGSSTDLKRIYADPRFRGSCPYLGHTLPIRRIMPALIEHEEVEGILLVLGTDEAGKPYHYDGAHEIATAAEERKARRIIERLGLRWDRNAYEDIFKPFLKFVVKPPWPNIPVDLNLEPYRDDDPALYRALEKAILKASVADRVH